MTAWETWAAGVLDAVAAPISATNVATLWAWSVKESGGDVMRWNNPLNTTQWLRGSVDMNSVGVKRYGSVSDGILATQITLKNGYYPVILANLRASVPRAQWGNACANLGTWGTGCNWLQATYGPAPGNLGEDMALDPADPIVIELRARIKNIEDSISFSPGAEGEPLLGWINEDLKEILAAVQAIQPGGSAPEPAEPKTVTLDIPAQKITGTLS